MRVRIFNFTMVELSIVIGVMIGEALNLDDALKRFGGWMQSRVGRLTQPDSAMVDSSAKSAKDLAVARVRFINGFIIENRECVSDVAAS